MTPPFLKQYLTEALLKVAIRTPSQYALPLDTMRQTVELLCKRLPQRHNVDIRPLHLAGIRAEEIKPQGNPTQLVLHIHGGAFFLGSLNTHRAFLTDMANASGAQIIHLDYPLAPEHPYPAALNAIFSVYCALLEQGFKEKDIVISGDSCGANLALCLMLKLKEQGFDLPSGLMLLSPFLDMTLTSESIRYNRKHDALLSVEAVEMGMQYYLDNKIARDDPHVSPLFADLSGLPPTLVHVGSKDLLLDDARRFKEKAEAAQVDVYYSVYTGMWHCFHLFNHWFDEGKHALNDIAKFIQHVDK